jgi:glyoxylase-like metal-dependent hydrolase (beta-lactamase superfamily II)
MRTFLDTPRARIVGQPVGPFAMNQYLVICKGTSTAAIIDAGGEPEPFARAAEAAGARITHILQTHAHIDHVMGLPDTLALMPDLPIWLHPKDAPVYAAIPQQARMFGLPGLTLPRVTNEIREGESISVGDLVFHPQLTPGHSPGHVIFVNTDDRFIFGGDLLFKGSIGRTDLPLCNPADMKRSLTRLLDLEDDLTVYPGHMEPTTIGQERASNPFLQSLTPT